MMKISYNRNSSASDEYVALKGGAVVIPQATLKKIGGMALLVLVAELVPVWYVPPGIFAAVFVFYLLTMLGMIMGAIVFPSPNGKGKKIELFSVLTGEHCIDHFGRTVIVWLLVVAIFLFSGISFSLYGLRHGDVFSYFCLVLLIHSGLHLLPFSPFWTGRVIMEATALRKMAPLTIDAIQILICSLSLVVVTIIACLTHSTLAWGLVALHLLMLYTGLHHQRQLRELSVINSSPIHS